MHEYCSYAPPKKIHIKSLESKKNNLVKWARKIRDINGVRLYIFLCYQSNKKVKSISFGKKGVSKEANEVTEGALQLRI
jgi:hypothetical protein